MAEAGPAATFSLNALCFLALLWALLAWRRPLPPGSDLSAERPQRSLGQALIGIEDLRPAIARQRFLSASIQKSALSVLHSHPSTARLNQSMTTTK
jgi:hypothetical protein